MAPKLSNNEPIYIQLADRLREMIDQNALVPGDRLPAMKEIGERYAVSEITVRAALKLLAAEGRVDSRRRSGYFVRRPSPAERSTRDVKLLAAIVPNSGAFHDAAIVRGITDVSAQSGYQLVVANTGDNFMTEAAHIQELMGKVAGFVVFPSHRGGNLSSYAALSDASVPWVFVDRTVPGITAPLVATDNLFGASLAVRHLTEIGLREIYLICAGQTTGVQERITGFKRALKEAGLPSAPSSILHSRFYRFEEGYTLAKKLVSERTSKAPFGIFTCDEQIARVVVDAIKEAGLSIPDDVKLVTFDDFVAAYMDPPLTTVRQLSEEMGRGAARLLIEILRTGRMPQQTEIRLRPELILRGSTTESQSLSLIERRAFRSVASA